MCCVRCGQQVSERDAVLSHQYAWVRNLDGSAKDAYYVNGLTQGSFRRMDWTEEDQDVILAALPWSEDHVKVQGVACATCGAELGCQYVACESRAWRRHQVGRYGLVANTVMFGYVEGAGEVVI